MNQVLQGDCLELMREMPDSSVDAVVTDPPYGLAFMSKKWDYDVPAVAVWREVLRVLKPGGHALVFAGTRTQHRMAVNLEDAGFEIRDMLAWVYGSGFPKSHDISKAIDKAAGAEREQGARVWSGGERIGGISHGGSQSGTAQRVIHDIPATPEALQWQGFGTALKPALEPITLCRKPFKGTVAANVLKWGTGGLNIDGCRVGTEEDQRRPSRGGNNGLCGTSTFKIRERKVEDQVKHQGRFPANLIHDGSDEVVAMFPKTKSRKMLPTHTNAKRFVYGQNVTGGYETTETFGDSDSAARFFYCAKASRAERGEDNNHPTVKPLKLMRYLCKLITPPGGVVLDPFAGSGTTGLAAREEGFSFILMEREPESCRIAECRLAAEDNLFMEVAT